MRSTINPDHVTFSAGARVAVGARPATAITEANLRAAVPTLPFIGLLGAGVTFTIEQTMRQKMDRFPEVLVAEAIQAESARAELTVSEWTNANLQLALGLLPADTTNVVQAAGPPIVPAHVEMPVGRRSIPVHRMVRIVEYLTDGRMFDAVFWRARIGIRGAFQLNAAAEGADIPLAIEALFEPAVNMLVMLRNYERLP